jgi:PPP family 3-phenylpropionic acid transporter
VSVLPAAIVACMLAGFVVALTLPPARRHAVHETAPFTMSRGIADLLIAGFCNAVAHGALYAFLTLHLKALGYSGAMIGVLWTVGVVAEIVVFLWLPQLFRRYSLPLILAASLALGAVRFAAIGWLADVLWIVLLAQLLHAFTFGSFHAASVAAVHRLFPEHAQARGQTLFSSLSNGAGAAAGMLLAGWAWQGGGAGMAFSACAAVSAAGVFFAARLKRANL